MGARRSREQWVAILRAFERSGQPVTRFCAKRQIRPDTLKWWRWRLREASSVEVGTEREAVRLVPIDVVGVATAGEPRVIAISVSNVEVRIEVGTDVSYVGTLVAELRSRC